MAENTASKDADPTRGLPYYEKLRKDLRETLEKKRLLDKNMATLEDQIYRHESTYLGETTAGNIIKGFDNYIKGTSSAPSNASNPSNQGNNTRRKATLVEADRVFSRSSASFMRELSPGPSESGRDTPRTGGTPGADGANKKKKKGSFGGRGEEEESADKGPKRLKITYARGGVGE
ncbi:MAG: hypothetical protein Q9163_000569 [Psora crenata]